MYDDLPSTKAEMTLPSAVNDKLIFSGGLRATHYSVTNKLYIEPRANFTYLLSNSFKIKGAWGKYNQFANRIVREDIQQGSRDF